MDIKKRVTFKLDTGISKSTTAKSSRPSSTAGTRYLQKKSDSSTNLASSKSSTASTQLHKPGQLPAYIHGNKRPVTATSRLQLKTTPSETNRSAPGTTKTGEASTPCRRTCSTDRIQTDSDVPPWECLPRSEGCWDGSAQQASLKRMMLLQKEVAAKEATISGQAKEISKLELCVNDAEQTVARLRKDLEKSDGLVAKYSLRVETLQRQLTKLEGKFDKQQTSNSELTEKLTAAEAHVVQLELDMDNVNEQLAAKNRKLAEKDAQVIKLQANVGRLEAQQIGELRASIGKLQTENEMLVSAKNQDDISLKSRSSLLNTARDFRKDLDAMQGMRLGGVNSGHSEQRCTAVRSNLLGMLAELKNDNRDLRQIMERELGSIQSVHGERATHENDSVPNARHSSDEEKIISSN